MPYKDKRGKENTNIQRRYDSRRLEKQSDKAKAWRLMHPGYDAERRRRERAPFDGRHISPQLIDEVMTPIRFKSNNLLVASDWHIPFHDADLVQEMLKTAKQYSVEDIAVPGDFFDCDNYKVFINLPWGETFRMELEEVAMHLQILVDTFKRTYFCRGNHEYRWIRQNIGQTGMRELFNLTGILDGYEVTEDNWMTVGTARGDWMLAHPRQYRQTKLSLAGDLAEKYHINTFCAHGHFFDSGWSKSGWYQVVDGGGMFDADLTGYLRDITTYPWTLNGYWLLQDGYAIPFEGKRKNKVKP